MTPLLDRQMYRTLPQADTGPVYTFDIDKTYLDTHLSNARDLLRIPLELAIDKRPYGGMADLIRACQRGSDAVGADRPAFFVSASPKQMRSVLERRMELDEITVDGLTLKRWGHYLRRGNFSGLTHQIPYKLTALLTTRAELPAGSYEILFGDDTESDALIYSMYSAVLTRALGADALGRALEAHGVSGREREPLLSAVAALEPLLPRLPSQPVRAIFIHAVRGEPRELVVDPLGVTPVLYKSSLLPAALLFRDRFINLAALRGIHRAVRGAQAWAKEEARDRVEPVLASIDPAWKTKLFDGEWAE